MEPRDADAEGARPAEAGGTASAPGGSVGPHDDQAAAPIAGDALDVLPVDAADTAGIGVVGLLGPAGEFIDKGGIAIWAITALSVITLAIILWRVWRHWRSGTWRRVRAEAAVEAWQGYRDVDALAIASSGTGLRAGFAAAAIRCVSTPGWSDEEAREETARFARAILAEARAGLRALELIATVAPLLGLLGTVLGMITAFQQLQAAGTRADPSALAGGIWEALLTTAAGMAVAIPASCALSWFDSVTDRLRHDLEDIATRIMARPGRPAMKHAAE